MLPLGDLAEVLGSLYVIEAAGLEGRAITPHLKSTLGLGQGRGASYFHGFGGETGVMWNNFRVLASLEIGESSRVTVQACKSAKRTFAALIDLFAPLAPACTEGYRGRNACPPRRRSPRHCCGPSPTMPTAPVRRRWTTMHADLAPLVDDSSRPAPLDVRRYPSSCRWTTRTSTCPWTTGPADGDTLGYLPL